MQGTTSPTHFGRKIQICTLDGVLPSKLNTIQNLVKPKYITYINCTYFKFVGNCRRNYAGCLSAVYTLMVD